MTEHTLQTITQFCIDHDACEPAVEWLQSLPPDTTPQAAWELCLSETINQSDWALWYAGQVVDGPKPFQWIALEIAEIVQHLAPDESRAVLMQVRSFLNGEDVDIGAAARAAANAAANAAAYAARAAYAAANAAAYAAANAAAYAAAYAAANAARAETKKETCHIVLKYFPTIPFPESERGS